MHSAGSYKPCSWLIIVLCLYPDLVLHEVTCDKGPALLLLILVSHKTLILVLFVLLFCVPTNTYHRNTCLLYTSDAADE